MVQGVMDVMFHQQMTVCVSSFADRPVQRCKHTALSIALPSLAHIVTVGPASSRVDEVKKKKEYENEETPSPGDQKTWEGKVRAGLDDDNVQRDVLRLFRERQDTWSGRLRQTGVAKHRIELTLGTKLIYQAPFRAVPRSRQTKEAEIKGMRDAGSIEPTLPERAGPAILVSKRTARHGTVSTADVECRSGEGFMSSTAR